jgi:hypothetical protein
MILLWGVLLHPRVLTAKPLTILLPINPYLYSLLESTRESMIHPKILYFGRKKHLNNRYIHGYVRRTKRFLRGERKNLGGRSLRGNNNKSRGVSRDHTREDTSINNEEVVSAVDLGVEIDDSGTASSAAVIGTHLGATHPVIGAPSTGVDGVLFALVSDPVFGFCL